MMDIQTVVLVAVWLAAVIFFSMNGKRIKKNRPAGPKRPQMPQKQGKQSEPFDYAHFRDRLRRSWGLDQGHTEEDRESVPARAGTVSVKDHSVQAEQEPFSASRYGMKNREHADEENPRYTGKTSVQAVQSPLSGVEDVPPLQGRASLQKFKKWIVYDAVFGAPRGMDPVRMPYQNKRRK